MTDKLRRSLYMYHRWHRDGCTLDVEAVQEVGVALEGRPFLLEYPHLGVNLGDISYFQYDTSGKWTLVYDKAT